MKAYMIFMRTSEVRDAEAMAQYRSSPKAEGVPTPRPLVVYGAQEQVEGANAPEALVVLEFDSVEDAKAWYHSPEYQVAKDHRLRAADYQTIIVEGFDPAQYAAQSG